MPVADFGLKDKVAIVTGASRGIGEAIATGFAEQGATVVLCSRKQEGVDAAAERIVAAGGKAVPIACHTGKPEMIDALYDRVQDELGRVDILVNNAATNPYFGPMVDIPEAAFDKTFEVNVKGYFLMAQKAGQRMVEQGGGSIINVASIVGMSPAPMQGVYSITKAAVIMMTKAFANELGAAGVRCNCICPGLVETKFAQVLIDTPEMLEWFTGQTPMGRHGQPNEMVGTAILMASAAGGYMNGAVVTLDGGFSV
jgi:NAD(P)-dependent dehydrogenase (short-subunit alcohol dehydrogenase family)